MTVPFTHMLFLAILLFLMGGFCVITRKNLLMILIGVEIMLNAAGLVFVASALRWQDLNGQVMTLFVMTAAAAEIAVALALIVCIHRRTGSIKSDRYSLLKG
jgi:NADH-quinone oxidoreductase subunit K